MGWHSEKFVGAGYVPDVSFRKMAVHAALYQAPVGHVQEVRQLPWSVIGIGFRAVDPPQPFVYRALGATNLNVTTVRRNKNVNEARPSGMLGEKLIRDYRRRRSGDMRCCSLKVGYSLQKC